MDYVVDGEWTTNMYQNDNWEQNWYGTENVREIRG